MSRRRTGKVARWLRAVSEWSRVQFAQGVAFTRAHPWLVAVAALVIMLFVTPRVSHAGPSHEQILDAIRMVESGGNDRVHDGDGGRAIGPFQIHEIYWKDAVAADPALGPQSGFDYQDCRQRDYAAKVLEAYMRRWVPDAWESRDAEVIARTHNGGPRGADKRATDRYWAKVARRLGR